MSTKVHRPYCGDCVDWFLKQRRRNPAFQLADHAAKCVCNCHTNDKFATRGKIEIMPRGIDPDWLKIAGRQ